MSLQADSSPELLWWHDDIEVPDSSYFSAMSSLIQVHSHIYKNVIALLDITFQFYEGGKKKEKEDKIYLAVLPIFSRRQ